MVWIPVWWGLCPEGWKEEKRQNSGATETSLPLTCRLVASCSLRNIPTTACVTGRRVEVACWFHAGCRLHDVMCWWGLYPEGRKRGSAEHRRHRDIPLVSMPLSLVLQETYRQRPVLQAAESKLPVGFMQDEDYDVMTWWGLYPTAACDTGRRVEAADWFHVGCGLDDDTVPWWELITVKQFLMTNCRRWSWEFAMVDCCVLIKTFNCFWWRIVAGIVEIGVEGVEGRRGHGCYQVEAGAGPSKYSMGDFHIVLCATSWYWSTTSWTMGLFLSMDCSRFFPNWVMCSCKDGSPLASWRISVLM